MIDQLSIYDAEAEVGGAYRPRRRAFPRCWARSPRGLGAIILQDIVRVAFRGTPAIALTAGIGTLSGTSV
jgi:hypothetical protein